MASSMAHCGLPDTLCLLPLISAQSSHLCAGDLPHAAHEACVKGSCHADGLREDAGWRGVVPANAACAMHAHCSGSRLRVSSTGLELASAGRRQPMLPVPCRSTADGVWSSCPDWH